MLASLFGDLGPAREMRAQRANADDAPADGFAATSILESVATEVNANGQMVDRHSHDLVVTGSPAQAIRDHFATTRSDLDTATSLITLLDPNGVWASAVIKALSDAGGRPIQRLHLREHLTLRTLATIERTTLVRRHEDTLRIYYADVRAPGHENAEIPVVLMERSQMTAVIIGPMQPHAIDAMLDALHGAVMLPTWRCPDLLFMLPPNAIWIANKIGALPWPGRLHVHVLSESMTGASSVWNALLGVWNQVQAHAIQDRASNPPPGIEEFPVPRSDSSGAASVLSASAVSTGADAPFMAPQSDAASPDPESTSPLLRVNRTGAERAHAQQALAGLLVLDGVLGGALVDSTTGLVQARETLADAVIDLDRSAAACAQVMRAHRQAARGMGLSDQVDEVIVSAGSRQQMMRTISRHPDHFIMLLLDKQRANLARVRLQLADVEREFE